MSTTIVDRVICITGRIVIPLAGRGIFVGGIIIPVPGRAVPVVGRSVAVGKKVIHIFSWQSCHLYSKWSNLCSWQNRLSTWYIYPCSWQDRLSTWYIYPCSWQNRLSTWHIYPCSWQNRLTTWYIYPCSWQSCSCCNLQDCPSRWQLFGRRPLYPAKPSLSWQNHPLAVWDEPVVGKDVSVTGSE
jgi:hypothetical protein